MKTIGLSIVIFLISTSIVAQDKSNYQLLWKIQKAGKSTGYLFGTMHVNDEEVYDMSDSVLVCLDRCDQVAFELDFDELTENVFSDMIQSFADAKYNEDLYEKDTDAYSLEDVAPIDEFLTPPPPPEYPLDFESKKSGKKSKSKVDENLEQEVEEKKKSKYTAPLDLYLHNRAKFHGQKITGLEVIEDQMRIFIKNKDEQDIKELPDSVLRSEFLKYIHEESKTAVKGGHEQLSKLYQRGDIQAIDSLFQLYQNISGDDVDFNMVSRNVVMANGIDSLLSSGTLFAAVGAAHLPGTKGVIELLQTKGYELTPVKATFTGLASTMLEENLTLPGNWVRFRIPDGSFSVELPKQPEPLNYGNGAITMYMTMDLSSMKVYMAMEQKMYNAGKDRNVTKQLIDNITVMNSNAVINSTENIDISEGICTEVYYSIPEGSYRMRLIGKNDKMMMLMCGGAPGENLHHADFERFIQSIQTDDLPVLLNQDADLNWNTYHSTAGSFAVELPGNVKELTQKIQIDNDHFSKLRVVLNEIPAEMGSLHINLLTPTNIMQYNDLQSLRSVTDNFISESEMSGLEVESTDFSLDGFPAMSVTATSEDEIKNMVISLRGNTALFFEVVSPKASYHVFERVLSSFRWEPFEPIADKKYTIPDKTASVITFGPMSRLGRGDDLDLRYVAEADETTWTLNDYRSASYSELSYETFSPYFFHAYPDSLLLNTAKRNLGWTDSITTKTFSKDGKKLNITARTDSTKITHGVYEIFGDRLYFYQIEFPSDWKDIQKMEDIVESFTVNYSSDFDITKCRLAENLERIETNTDEENRYNLVNDLSDCRISPADSTLLLSAWFKNRPDDDLAYSNTLGALTQQLRSISEVDFIEKAKQKFNITESSQVKIFLLENILTYNNEKALAAYFELYPKLGPLEADSWLPVPSSYDTDYYTKHLVKILDFTLQHKELANEVLNHLYYSDLGINYNIFDSLHQEQIQKLNEAKALLLNEENKILQLIDVAIQLDEPKDYNDPTASAAFLISQLPASERSLGILKKLKPEKGSLGDYELLRAKKQHGIKIAKGQMSSVLESSFGYTLISELKKTEELSLIPKKYLTQQELDRLYLHYIMSEEDDGSTIKVKLLKEHKKTGIQGENVIYQYNLKWDYDGGESENTDIIIGPHLVGEPLNFDIEPLVRYNDFYSIEGSILTEDEKQIVIEQLLQKAVSKKAD